MVYRKGLVQEPWIKLFSKFVHNVHNADWFQLTVYFHIVFMLAIEGFYEALVNGLCNYCYDSQCYILISSIISSSTKIAKGSSWDLFWDMILFNVIINGNKSLLCWCIICMPTILLFKQIIFHITFLLEHDNNKS